MKLLQDACQDLEKLAASGRHLQFLKKLVLIEKNGDVGTPLGRELAGWRKVIVGNRESRIIYRVHEGVALVLCIGDRADSEVYRLAASRLETLPENPQNRMLAEVLLEVIERSQQRRKGRQSR